MSGVSLTLRGAAFLGGGVACTVAAVLFGSRDLLRIGILLLAVPVIALLIVGRTRVRLTAARYLDVRRLAVGEPARAAVRLTNESRLPTGTLLVEDTLPVALGSRPRFVVDRVRAREHRDLHYSVRPTTRGRFTMGPLTLRLTDPLGLWEILREFPLTDELVVTPQLVELPTLPLSGWASGGLRPPPTSSASGEDDVGVREYQHGDPLHRVHWRATARYGEVMVRREEQPERASAVLVLDNRQHAHAGTGRRSTFEDAVSVCASLAVALSARGYEVTVRTTAGELAPPPSGGGINDMLDQMADVGVARSTPASASGGRPESPWLRPGEPPPGLIFAVVRSIDSELAGLLTAWPSRGSSPAALLVSGRDSAAADNSGAGDLGAAGWRILPTPSPSDLVNTWSHMLSGHGNDTPAHLSTPAAMGSPR